MKKIFIILASAIAATTLFSCNKLEDFVTKVPEDDLSPATYFKGATELELFTNNFYSLILEDAGLAEENTDVHMPRSLSSLQKGTLTASSSSWSKSTFSPLRSINYFLENSSFCEDEAVRAKYEGVAYFFRAYYYYKLVRQYGDMPWYDHTIGSADTEDLCKPRDHRGFVIIKCLEDCDKAIAGLPDSWDVFHVTKNAARLLKSRIALFEGTFRKYHEGTAYVTDEGKEYEGVTISSKYFLEQAAEAAQAVISSGKCSLFTGTKKSTAYRDYFLLEQAETSETILSIFYTDAAEAMVRHGIQFDYKNGRRSATNRFVNHYLTSTGKSIKTVANWEKLSYYDQFQNRDPRMAQTLHGPSYIAIDGASHEILDFERTWSGYRIIKYISDTSHEGATTSTTDYPVFRYAEALLNYAEAKAELGTLTDADVAATIDQLRSRVGMVTMKTVPTTPDELMQEYYPNAKGSQLAAILEVRRERTIELFSEGFRQWDLLRWGEGKWLCPSTLKGFHGIYVGDATFKTDGTAFLDLDKDGKYDLLLLKGVPAPPGVSIPTTSQLDVTSGWSISADGYLTYFAEEDYVWNENKDYLWPIPADQRVLTHGALSQNPGWTDDTDFE